MSVEENKALAHRFVTEVLNGGNLDLIDDLVTEDFVEHEALPGLPATGPQAPRAFIGMFRAAFPDLQYTLETTIAEGDKVAMHGMMSGTHKGEFMGIPPTNKSFNVEAIDIVDIRDGRATAHWGLTDQAAMTEQLGITPAG